MHRILVQNLFHVLKHETMSISHGLLLTNLHITMLVIGKNIVYLIGPISAYVCSIYNSIYEQIAFEFL